MTRLISAAALLALLAACGADGAPRPPQPAPRTPGVTVGIDATAGVRTQL